jgi:hypothetical protein
MQVLGNDRVYLAASNSIYSVSTGAITWAGPSVPFVGSYGNYLSFPAAIAGPYAVYVYGHQVIVDSY